MTGLIESLSDSPSSAAPVKVRLAFRATVTDAVGVDGGVATAVETVVTVDVAAGVFNMVMAVVYTAPVVVVVAAEMESDDLIWLTDEGL